VCARRSKVAWTRGFKKNGGFLAQVARRGGGGGGGGGGPARKKGLRGRIRAEGGGFEAPAPKCRKNRGGGSITFPGRGDRFRALPVFHAKKRGEPHGRWSEALLAGFRPADGLKRGFMFVAHYCRRRREGNPISSCRGHTPPRPLTILGPVSIQGYAEGGSGFRDRNGPAGLLTAMAGGRSSGHVARSPGEAPGTRFRRPGIYSSGKKKRCGYAGVFVPCGKAHYFRKATTMVVYGNFGPPTARAGQTTRPMRSRRPNAPGKGRASLPFLAGGRPAGEAIGVNPAPRAASNIRGRRTRPGSGPGRLHRTSGPPANPHSGGAGGEKQASTFFFFAAPGRSFPLVRPLRIRAGDGASPTAKTDFSRGGKQAPRLRLGVAGRHNPRRANRRRANHWGTGFLP